MKIGGVPEHFNLPWKIVLENEEFSKISWKDCPGGTGEMLELLETQQLDAAMLLTEGALSSYLQKGTPEILELYVSSPLLWGVHVSSQSAYQLVSELSGTKGGISRRKSGSELMTKVMADRFELDFVEDQFVVCGHLKGLLEKVSTGECDFFLWEKFTTKPYVDNGQLRRIGEVPTPWPCFVLVAGEGLTVQSRELLFKALEEVRKVALALKSDSLAPELFAKEYGISREDITEWLQVTEWFGLQWNRELQATVEAAMRQYGLIG